MLRAMIAALALVLLFSSCGGGGTEIATDIADGKAISCTPVEITCIYAGQEIYVGSLWGYRDGTTLYLEYRITEPGWGLTEVHTHVAGDPNDFPMTDTGNPIPGQFMYQAEDLEGATEHGAYFTVGYPDTWCGIYIAAHAVVEKIDELLYNEGFEQPDLPDSLGQRRWGTGNGGVGSPAGGFSDWDVFADADIPGWNIQWTTDDTAGYLEYWRGHSEANPKPGPFQIIELDSDGRGSTYGESYTAGTHNNVKISQMFEDVSGDCVLSFWWKPRVSRSNNLGYDCEMEIGWNDTTVQDLNFGSSYYQPVPGKGGWSFNSFDLGKFKKDDLMIYFKETGQPCPNQWGGTGGYGTLLDDVSLACTVDETAWSCGEDFPGSNWATYTVYIACPPVE